MGLRVNLPRRDPPPLPWRRPRHELLILALVAVATLTPVYAINAQDVSRLCLTRSLVHGKITADSCLGTTFATDKSSYGGHLYSDKAPGMSALEIPGVEASRLPSVEYWPLESNQIWVVRILSSGLAFLLCAFMIGRISEGLEPGYGGAATVAFGLGTLAAPFAATSFEHVTAGALGLAAFALAWRRRPMLAGLAAGASLLVAYEAALIVLVLGVYVALQGGWALFRYARGVLPGVAILWTYNWLAFGAPWHLSYHYVADPTSAAEQSVGLFGIHLPYLHAVREVFVGSGGLLVITPVVLAAGGGIALLARRHRVEAAVCAVVTVSFVFLDCGYFLPYGGLSPGPRFLIPCLPFLALGLAPAFAARFRVTVLLALLSAIATVALTLTWANGFPAHGSIWAALVHARFHGALVANILHWAGPRRLYGAVLVSLAAALAFLVGIVGSGRAAAGRGARSATL